MIKRVIVTNHLGESVIINLTEEEPEHGFLIEEISGLGPPKGDISTTDLAISDGSIYNYAKLQERNIVIDLIFTPAPTIEDTRQRCYKYFPMKKPLKLMIETDNRRLECDGYVEGDEPDIFSKEERAQISIICPDSYLYSVFESDVTFSGLENLFEFPFSNELDGMNEPIMDDLGKDDPILDEYLEPIEDSNTYVPKTLEFSNIAEDEQKNVPYEGDSDVGITITMHFLGPVEDITIYNTGTREKMHLNTSRIESITGSPIMAGDTIIISTVKKHKTVTLIREGDETNILNVLDRGTTWFQLTKGDNWFAYVVRSGGANIQFTISYQILYEGI